jgi:hypothetical protein
MTYHVKPGQRKTFYYNDTETVRMTVNAGVDVDVTSIWVKILFFYMCSTFQPYKYTPFHTTSHNYIAMPWHNKYVCSLSTDAQLTDALLLSNVTLTKMTIYYQNSTRKHALSTTIGKSRTNWCDDNCTTLVLKIVQINAVHNFVLERTWKNIENHKCHLPFASAGVRIEISMLKNTTDQCTPCRVTIRLVYVTHSSLYLATDISGAVRHIHKPLPAHYYTAR